MYIPKPRSSCFLKICPYAKSKYPGTICIIMYIYTELSSNCFKTTHGVWYNIYIYVYTHLWLGPYYWVNIWCHDLYPSCSNFWQASHPAESPMEEVLFWCHRGLQRSGEEHQTKQLGFLVEMGTNWFEHILSQIEIRSTSFENKMRT